MSGISFAGTPLFVAYFNFFWQTSNNSFDIIGSNAFSVTVSWNMFKKSIAFFITLVILMAFGGVSQNIMACDECITEIKLKEISFSFIASLICTSFDMFLVDVELFNGITN